MYHLGGEGREGWTAQEAVHGCGRVCGNAVLTAQLWSEPEIALKKELLLKKEKDNRTADTTCRTTSWNGRARAGSRQAVSRAAI